MGFFFLIACGAFLALLEAFLNAYAMNIQHKLPLQNKCWRDCGLGFHIFNHQYAVFLVGEICDEFDRTLYTFPVLVLARDQFKRYL